MIEPELPSILCGETFSYVFGTDTGPLEHVLLKRDIMGPCWLTFKEPQRVEKAVCD
jgi:DNA polymerase alpha subunit A